MRVPDTTDYSKPFTLKVIDIKYTFFGKPRDVLVHVEQFRYPEEMAAAASMWDGSGYGVWTFGPEIWHDDRGPIQDTSCNFDDPMPDDDMPF